jgi:hypothetical protein
VFAEVVNGDNCRVIHLRDELGFSLKTLFSVRIKQRWRDKFDGDVAVE